MFHCLIEDTLTLLHVFQIDEIQYIVVLFAILILDGTEFPATFVFLDEIRIESDELADPPASSKEKYGAPGRHAAIRGACSRLSCGCERAERICFAR